MIPVEETKTGRGKLGAPGDAATTARPDGRPGTCGRVGVAAVDENRLEWPPPAQKLPRSFTGAAAKRFVVRVARHGRDDREDAGQIEFPAGFDTRRHAGGAKPGGRHAPGTDRLPLDWSRNLPWCFHYSHRLQALHFRQAGPTASSLEAIEKKPRHLTPPFPTAQGLNRAIARDSALVGFSGLSHFQSPDASPGDAVGESADDRAPMRRRRAGSTPWRGRTAFERIRAGSGTGRAGRFPGRVPCVSRALLAGGVADRTARHSGIRSMRLGVQAADGDRLVPFHTARSRFRRRCRGGGAPSSFSRCSRGPCRRSRGCRLLEKRCIWRRASGPRGSEGTGCDDVAARFSSGVHLLEPLASAQNATAFSVSRRFVALETTILNRASPPRPPLGDEAAPRSRRSASKTRLPRNVPR